MGSLIQELIYWCLACTVKCIQPQNHRSHGSYAQEPVVQGSWSSDVHSALMLWTCSHPCLHAKASLTISVKLTDQIRQKCQMDNQNTQTTCISWYIPTCFWHSAKNVELCQLKFCFIPMFMKTYCLLLLNLTKYLEIINLILKCGFISRKMIPVSTQESA